MSRVWGFSCGGRTVADGFRICAQRTGIFYLNGWTENRNNVECHHAICVERSDRELRVKEIVECRFSCQKVCIALGQLRVLLQLTGTGMVGELQPDGPPWIFHWFGHYKNFRTSK
ncbi:hypothetical protein AVEN_32685-1 [Araneus ventricosus]|uniref:Uncharacterized protein n=1 Tax=Araneus ventricosus TaxID=182803 RepID=A0A4Y2MK49_ARAVE|nr:hypothetical protein AVEN_32685-1 [Araneus ventricosus]